MKIPNSVKDFIEQKIEILEISTLPQFYPKLESFENFQLGYKVNAKTGEKLTGGKDGNFRENWYVVCSNYYNDPFFVDFSEEVKNFPVYFARSGDGRWTPIEVAESLSSFLVHISRIRDIENEKNKVLEYIKGNFDLNNALWGETYNECFEYLEEFGELPLEQDKVIPIK